MLYYGIANHCIHFILVDDENVPRLPKVSLPVEQLVRFQAVALQKLPLQYPNCSSEQQHFSVPQSLSHNFHQQIPQLRINQETHVKNIFIRNDLVVVKQWLWIRLTLCGHLSYPAVTEIDETTFDGLDFVSH